MENLLFKGVPILKHITHINVLNKGLMFIHSTLMKYTYQPVSDMASTTFRIFVSFKFF